MFFLSAKKKPMPDPQDARLLETGMPFQRIHIEWMKRTVSGAEDTWICTDGGETLIFHEHLNRVNALCGEAGLVP
jgi:hypothetical protein